jgi:hypothetical protein
VHDGRQVDAPGGQTVNPPLVRASTVLFKDTAEQRDMRGAARQRTPVHVRRARHADHLLEDAVSELEGAYRTRLFPSGLAAIGFTRPACLKQGGRRHTPSEAGHSRLLPRVGLAAAFSIFGYWPWAHPCRRRPKPNDLSISWPVTPSHGRPSVDAPLERSELHGLPQTIEQVRLPCDWPSQAPAQKSFGLGIESAW